MKKEEILKRLDYLLDKYGISEYKDKKIKELSKGNQQKIQFILAILNEPKLLILDEPFSGLDPFNVELFKQEIIELSKKGSMIIFSSHRMEHVELFCKKLAIIMHGKPVLEGYLKDIKEQYRKKNIFIKGDLKSITISAASVIAKVTRDRMLYELDLKYPMYDFKHNKGYPTKKHLEAISKYGILNEHRRSYGPVADYVKEHNL